MNLNFQYAHHSRDESETRSGISLSDALTEFDEFDWSEEIEKSNKLKKCSPTLSVIINGNHEMVWVSGYGNPDNPEFVSECYFPGEVKKWFGLTKGQGTVNLSTQTFTKDQARKAIELLIAKNYRALRELYA